MVAYTYPALAAALCPSCYRLERETPNLIVEAGMPAAMRRQLESDIALAETTVRSFYGTFEKQPLLIACATDACDLRLGGRGSRAATMSTPLTTVIRLAPSGLNPTILAHEFSHVELLRRLGTWALIKGILPAWVDEGVAVIVSNDDRFLRPGFKAADRCLRDTDRPLPVTPFEWGPIAGKDTMIYADAACRVLHWIDANGGTPGLLRALDSVAAGHHVNFGQRVSGS
jgi:hypothetical protein